MTEAEYLTVENLTRLRDAGRLLSEITPGYGLTEQERVEITSRILAITQRMSKALKLDEEGEE
jgi:hypothetical protein